MANFLEHADFWLPSEEDLISFPTEFPFELENNEEEGEDFLDGLTRRLTQSSLNDVHKRPQSFTLEQHGNMAGSPQSTLSGVASLSASSNGSPNGPSRVPSPQNTNFVSKNETLDLIYAAADQVARLKMYQQSRALLDAQNSAFKMYMQAQPMPQPQGVHHQHMLNRGRAVGFESSRCGGYPVGVTQSAWSRPCMQQPQQMRTVFLGGSDVKKKSTGTGVFLPRRVGKPVENRKKSGCPNVLIPPKVVQALNLSFDEMNGQAQPRFISGSGYSQIHVDAMMGKSKGLLRHQRRNIMPHEGPLNHELRLPQEWTY